MKQKKSNPGKPHKKATVSTPINELNTKETIEHYNAIMIEEFRSSTKFLADGLAELRTFFTNELNQFRNEVNYRFSILEGAFRCLKSDFEELKSDVAVLKTDVAVLKTDVAVLKTDVAVLKSDVQEIRTDMRHMESRLTIKIDKLVTGHENHEVRITALEAGQV